MERIVESLPILFSSNPKKYAPYHVFSNFSPARIIVEGVSYPTTEHAYQAAKTDDPKEKLEIRLASTASEAKKLGGRCKMRPDWADAKLGIMRLVCRAKFYQNDDFRRLLVSTGTRILVEDAPWDEYWGNGKTGTGKNMLGKILMEIRSEFASR